MTLGMERGMLCYCETAYLRRDSPLAKGDCFALTGFAATSVYKMNSTILPSSSSSSLWLTLARVFQILIICLSIGLFIMNIPLNYEQRSILCDTDPCPPNQLSIRSAQALENIGMSVHDLVTLTIALDILIAIIFTGCAIVIFVRKPNDPFTIFVTITLVTFGTATFTGGMSGIVFAYPQLEWLTQTIAMIGSVSILAFFFVFPNGRFTPRWTIAILLGWFLFQLPRYYFPNSSLNLYEDSAIYNLLFVAFFLSGVAAQVYRYIRESDDIERQQTKWVIYGLTIGMGGYLDLKDIEFSDLRSDGQRLACFISGGYYGDMFHIAYSDFHHHCHHPLSPVGHQPHHQSHTRLWRAEFSNHCFLCSYCRLFCDVLSQQRDQHRRFHLLPQASLPSSSNRCVSDYSAP